MKPSPSKSRKPSLGLEATVLVAAGIAGVLGFVPVPFYRIAPGRAVDLATRIVVEGHAAPATRFLLTDVTVGRLTALGLVTAFMPATQIVPAAAVMPPGENPTTFAREMDDAMTDSQTIAALVAEREAGYRVPAPRIAATVVGFPPGSGAATALRPGDRLDRVGGRDLRDAGDLARAVAALAPGARVALDVERGGVARRVVVRTMRVAHGVRLGVYVRGRPERVALPVPVRFDVGDISGASAGLMFGLQIYADLRGLRAHARAVAGTGTLAFDGTVGRIEGTRGKYAAAERAGASLFLVPVANAADLANERGPRVVAVRTFGDALRALSSN